MFELNCRDMLATTHAVIRLPWEIPEMMRLASCSID